MRLRAGQDHPGQHRTHPRPASLAGAEKPELETSRPSGEIHGAQPKFPDNLNLGVDQRKLAVLTQPSTAERRARPAANRCFCTCKPSQAGDHGAPAYTPLAQNARHLLMSCQRRETGRLIDLPSSWPMQTWACRRHASMTPSTKEASRWWFDMSTALQPRGG